MIYGSSYILANGEFLILKELGFNTHYDYEKYLEKRSLIKRNDKKVRYVTNNHHWVRINDGSNFGCEVIVELPIKPITEEQYQSLLKFLDYLMYSNKEFVEVGIEEHSIGTKFTDKSIWFKHYEFRDYLPDDIIKEIKQMYLKITPTGVKRQ